MRTAFAVLVIVLAATAVASAQAAVPVFQTGRLYLTEAEFNQAIQPYQQAIQADARNFRAHYWLGFAYVFAFRQWSLGAAPYASAYLPRAVPALAEAIKLNPQMVEAYSALHDAYVLMGDLVKAEEVVQQQFQQTRPGWLPKLQMPPGKDT